MEADLGRRLTEKDISDEAKMRELEPKLLNRLTMDIFERGAAAKAAGGGAVEGTVLPTPEK
jgi:hypothetical protein